MTDKQDLIKKLPVYWGTQHMNKNGYLEKKMCYKSRSNVRVQRKMGRAFGPGKLERVS